MQMFLIRNATLERQILATSGLSDVLCSGGWSEQAAAGLKYVTVERERESKMLSPGYTQGRGR